MARNAKRRKAFWALLWSLRPGVPGSGTVARARGPGPGPGPRDRGFGHRAPGSRGAGAPGPGMGPGSGPRAPGLAARAWCRVSQALLSDLARVYPAMPCPASAPPGETPFLDSSESPRKRPRSDCERWSLAKKADEDYVKSSRLAFESRKISERPRSARQVPSAPSEVGNETLFSDLGPPARGEFGPGEHLGPGETPGRLQDLGRPGLRSDLFRSLSISLLKGRVFSRIGVEPRFRSVECRESRGECVSPGQAQCKKNEKFPHGSSGGSHFSTKVKSPEFKPVGGEVGHGRQYVARELFQFETEVGSKTPGIRCARAVSIRDGGWE